ncbi:IclR family transcriptional regulator [Pseudonocardia acaciae]|uniref:IclR family transcriptional regulator n=1 Tax=Pseudonocardia acaciae TaxID=551276 RepID=UPI0006891928|nr:IclR family transcriptional regulator [Pseudonocardia acaciae]
MSDRVPGGSQVPGEATRSSVGRAMSVLATFTAARVELNLSEISRRSGLPLTTTHRLVGQLTRWGALEQTQHGYQVGLRLWEIGALAPRGHGLREIAMPFLEDLYEATRQNVQLAVVDGRDAVYVERLSSRTAVGIITRVGGRLPLHATGVGLVLLAFADPEFQERVLAAPMRRFTEKTIVSPGKLRRVIADVRKRRIAVSDGQITLDALSVAAPVFGPDGTVQAALSVVVPSDRPPSEYIPAVHAAARGISRGLGWMPDNPSGRRKAR